MLERGWHVINYHNIDWEDSFHLRAISGTVRPDIFRKHLEWFQAHSDLISISEGLERLQSGEPFTRPCVSLWFDDGYRSVRRNALPICREFGMTAAVAINSRFALRTEMYWMAKLSYLACTDGLRFLRSRLRREYDDVPLRIRTWTKSNFSERMNQIVDEVYCRFTTPAMRADAFRLFDDAEGIAELVRSGWLIANHSAAHYPLTKNFTYEAVAKDLAECEGLVKQLNPHNRHFVVPFDYIDPMHVDKVAEKFSIVHVRDRVNTIESFASGRIYRFTESESQAPRIVARG
jgi:peptidoglycan/xylan/chitin deacetylase (PgdA/CDA1 family)